MKTRFLIILPGILWMAAMLWPSEAAGIPVFARKYGFNCTMCHTAMPRLNDFGQRYRANGYRLPGRENEERTVLESPAPVALRTSAGYNAQLYNKASEQPNSGDLEVNGLDILSGGLVSRDIGYFMILLPQIGGARGLAAQDGGLEMASVVFNRLGRSSWLNLRVGRFEPAFVAFSVKRQFSASPYEVYDVAIPGGPAFSETQTGIELSGYGRQPVRYAVGLVDGSANNRPIDSPADVYGRLACIIGPGEGQTAGQRLGVVGYLGRSRPEGRPGTSPESFYRAGADASLNASVVNLALQFLYGGEKPVLRFTNGGADVTWWGGFGEVTVTPRVDLVGFARVDHLETSDAFGYDVTRFTAGGRFYPEDNVALHAEFSRRRMMLDAQGAGDPAESFVTARVDFAF